MSTTLARFTSVGSALGSGVLTDREALIVRWQFNMLGGFKTALMTLIAQADDSNLSALSLGFPAECAAFREWAEGDMAVRLRAMGIDL